MARPRSRPEHAGNALSSWAHNLEAFPKLVAVDQGISTIDPVQQKLQAGVLRNNSIRELSGFRQFSKLKTLSLANNEVSSLDAVGHLVDCPSLAHLYLSGNPIAALPNYRPRVVAALPRLASLDGKKITPEERDRAVDFVEREETVLALVQSNAELTRTLFEGVSRCNLHLALLKRVLGGGHAMHLDPEACELTELETSRAIRLMRRVYLEGEAERRHSRERIFQRVYRLWVTRSRGAMVEQPSGAGVSSGSSLDSWEGAFGTLIANQQQRIAQLVRSFEACRDKLRVIRGRLLAKALSSSRTTALPPPSSTRRSQAALLASLPVPPSSSSSSAPSALPQQQQQAQIPSSSSASPPRLLPGIPGPTATAAEMLESIAAAAVLPCSQSDEEEEREVQQEQQPPQKQQREAKEKSEPREEDEARPEEKRPKATSAPSVASASSGITASSLLLPSSFASSFSPAPKPRQQQQQARPQTARRPTVSFAFSAPSSPARSVSGPSKHVSAPASVLPASHKKRQRQEGGSKRPSSASAAAAASFPGSAPGSISVPSGISAAAVRKAAASQQQRRQGQQTEGASGRSSSATPVTEGQQQQQQQQQGQPQEEQPRPSREAQQLKNIQALQAQLQEKEDEISQLKTRLGKYRERLELFQRQNVENVEEAEREIGRLHGQLKNAHEELDAARQRIVALQTQAHVAAQREKSLRALEAERDELRDRIAHGLNDDSSRDYFQTQMAQLTEEKEQMIARIAELEVNVSAQSQANVQRLQQELEASREEVTELRAQVHDLQMEYEPEVHNKVLGARLEEVSSRREWSLLSRAMSRWKARLERRRRLHSLVERCTLSLQASLLREGLSRLARHARAERRRYEVEAESMLLRAADHCNSSGKRRCLQIWRTWSSRKRELSEGALAFAAYKSYRIMAQWHQAALAASRARRLDAIASRIEARQMLQFGMERWKDAVEAGRQEAFMMLRAAYFWTKRVRSSAIQAWKGSLEEARETRERKDKIVRHRAVRLSRAFQRSLGTWRRWTRVRTQTRKVVEGLEERRNASATRRIFYDWALFVTRKRLRTAEATASVLKTDVERTSEQATTAQQQLEQWLRDREELQAKFEENNERRQRAEQEYEAMKVVELAMRERLQEISQREASLVASRQALQEKLEEAMQAQRAVSQDREQLARALQGLEHSLSGRDALINAMQSLLAETHQLAEQSRFDSVSAARHWVVNATQRLRRIVESHRTQLTGAPPVALEEPSGAKQPSASPTTPLQPVPRPSSPDTTRGWQEQAPLTGHGANGGTSGYEESDSDAAFPSFAPAGTRYRERTPAARGPTPSQRGRRGSVTVTGLQHDTSAVHVSSSKGRRHSLQPTAGASAAAASSARRQAAAAAAHVRRAGSVRAQEARQRLIPRSSASSSSSRRPSLDSTGRPRTRTLHSQRSTAGQSASRRLSQSTANGQRASSRIITAAAAASEVPDSSLVLSERDWEGPYIPRERVSTDDGDGDDLDASPEAQRDASSPSSSAAREDDCDESNILATAAATASSVRRPSVASTASSAGSLVHARLTATLNSLRELSFGVPSSATTPAASAAAAQQQQKAPVTTATPATAPPAAAAGRSEPPTDGPLRSTAAPSVPVAQQSLRAQPPILQDTVSSSARAAVSTVDRPQLHQQQAPAAPAAQPGREQAPSEPTAAAAGPQAAGVQPAVQPAQSSAGIVSNTSATRAATPVPYQHEGQPRPQQQLQQQSAGPALDTAALQAFLARFRQENQAPLSPMPAPTAVAVRSPNKRKEERGPAPGDPMDPVRQSRLLGAAPSLLPGIPPALQQLLPHQQQQQGADCSPGRSLLPAQPSWTDLTRALVSTVTPLKACRPPQLTSTSSVSAYDERPVRQRPPESALLSLRDRTLAADATDAAAAAADPGYEYAASLDSSWREAERIRLEMLERSLRE